ncbi:MAG TPA: hypothetical protein VF783_21110 [Terriglobales bacterium]
MSSPDCTLDAIDLVAATEGTFTGVVEHAILGVELVDGRAPMRRVVLTEDIVEIAGQQGRYTIGHGLPPLGVDFRLGCCKP